MKLDSMFAAKQEAEKFLTLLENTIDEMTNSRKNYPGGIAENIGRFAKIEHGLDPQISGFTSKQMTGVPNEYRRI